MIKIPRYDQLMNPVINALRELGGSGSIDEIYEKVIEALKMPDDVLVFCMTLNLPIRRKFNTSWLGREPILKNSDFWKSPVVESGR